MGADTPFDDTPQAVSLDLPEVQPGTGDVKFDEYGTEITAHASIAKQVAQMIRAGVPLSVAEKEAHVKLSGPMANQAVKAALVKILDYEMPATERRRLVRARMNKILLEGEDNDAVKAAKIIADDPEVNISQQKAGPDVQITFSKETLNLFQQLEGEK